MAEYKSLENTPLSAYFFHFEIFIPLMQALSSRGIPVDSYTFGNTQKVSASEVAPLWRVAYDTLNYSSFIESISSTIKIKHQHAECLSQATSDLNNLLRCRSGCTGNCHSSCTGACTSSCSGSTHHSGSCSYATWFCSGDCNNYCAGGCSGSCEGTCGQGCNNYCVSSCKNSSISSANRLPGTMVSV